MCPVNNVSLLIADDEHGIRDVMYSLSKDHVSSIETFSDGNSTLAYIEKNHVDIAVLDICMPGLDGISLLEEIKQILHPI